MTTIKIRRKGPGKMLTGLIGLISIALISAVWVQMNGRQLSESLRDTPVDLQVPPLMQSLGTSCGEAVIVMAYNYLHMENPLNEVEVINYASENGYFTEEIEPFTSPANMVKIARHYTRAVSSGNVSGPDQGLALLIRKLKNGEPVIIDVLTRFEDPNSGAHFVLVTGASMDSNDSNVVTIHYNNPQTGVNESALWEGDEGIWNAWKNNPDPGGPGWWLVISSE